MWPPAFEEPIQHKSMFAEIRETDGKDLSIRNHYLLMTSCAFSCHTVNVTLSSSHRSESVVFNHFTLADPKNSKLVYTDT